MCTSLALPAPNGTHLFGRTLDLDIHFGEAVTITPRRYPFAFADCYPHTHHYALLGMAAVADSPAARGYPLYAEAMNEKGLCMAGLRLAESAVYADTPRGGWLNLAPWELIPYLLGTCATVGEARAALGDIWVVDKPFSDTVGTAPLHWHMVDADPAHGGLIVEVTSEGMRLYEAETGALANEPPYPAQLSALQAAEIGRAHGGLVVESEPTKKARGELFVESEPTKNPCGELFVESEPTKKAHGELFVESEPTKKAHGGLFVESEPTKNPCGELFVESEPTKKAHGGLVVESEPTKKAHGEWLVEPDPTALPAGYGSPARFARASILRRWWLERGSACAAVDGTTPTAGYAVAQFFSLLGAVSPTAGAVMTPEGGCHRTLYTCCMDTAAGVYYYKTESHPSVRTVAFHGLDLNGDKVVVLS